MALSNTSKTQLNALLGLLNTHKDRDVAQALMGAARRLLPPGAERDAVLGIINTDGWGSASLKTTEQAALTALLADIAAN